MTDTPLPKEIALEARAQVGERLSSPSARRNMSVISKALATRLVPDARVLEVAAGTGEHALACVTERPDLIWTPSEPNPESRASVDAWAVEGQGTIRTCLDLDVTSSDWTKTLGQFDALYCANMIHIAPWEAAQGLFQGAGQLLTDIGRIYLYGPFQEGASTANSNLSFDADLKRRDRRWGVRALNDVDALAEDNGFRRVERLEMPANNLLLTWERAA